MATYNLRFSITIDKESSLLTFEDTTTYLSTDYGKGIIEILSPLGNTVYKNSGFDTDDYSTPDIANTSVEPTFEVSLPSEIEVGEYTINYKAEVYLGNGTLLETDSIDNVINYCYESPEVKIDYSISCDNSTLKSIDSSDYAALINKVPTLPTLYVRNHGVQAPYRSGFGVIADDTAAVRTFVNIWTNVWQTAITTSLAYAVSTWDDGSLLLAITDSVSGDDDANVSCNRCYCNLNSCISNLYQKWVAASSSMGILSYRLQRDVLRVTSLYTQYKQAAECGDETTNYCQEMADILGQNDCTCDLSSDDASVLVVPVTEQALGSEILFGIGSPTTQLGKNTDMYIDTNSYDIYSKDAGLWTKMGNIKGEKGDTAHSGYFTYTFTLTGSQQFVDFFISNDITLSSFSSYSKTSITGDVDIYLTTGSPPATLTQITANHSANGTVSSAVSGSITNDIISFICDAGNAGEVILVTAYYETI